MIGSQQVSEFSKNLTKGEKTCQILDLPYFLRI